MEKGSTIVDEEHGIYRCSKCRGLGGKYISGDQKIIICPICHGEGYVDWIQKVTGKPSRSLTELLANSKRIMHLESLYSKYNCEPPPGLEGSFVYDDMKREYKIFKRGHWYTIPDQMLTNNNKVLKEMFESWESISASIKI